MAEREWIPIKRGALADAARGEDGAEIGVGGVARGSRRSGRAQIHSRDLYSRRRLEGDVRRREHNL